MAAKNTFSIPDYIVFSLVLLISAGIGIFYGCTGGKQKTTREIFMADKSMTVLPVALSLLASFMSAITLLGTPAEIYVFGTQYWMIWIGYCIMIPLAAHVYLPIFFNLKLTSVFEYLELRFSKGVRISGAIVFILQMILYMAIVLYTPSLALNIVTGLNVWISVLSVGIVCTFYTTLGGIKAVMWTDVFQICIMFAGLMAVLIQGSIDWGGFDKIWDINAASGRVEFFVFDPNPFLRHNIWSLVFGGCFTWLAIYGVNQAQVQRALTVPTLRQAQIALWINLPGLTALATICGLCGMVVYAQYKDCDPIRNKDIVAKDQLLPYYVMDRMAYLKGLPGLFTACLFSGALSTISSGLNSLAAVTLEDLIKSIPRFKNISEERATLLSKVMALVYGALMIGLTFVASQLGGVLQAALGLFGMLGGPVLGVYTLGIVYPMTNKIGAYAGLFSGLILTLWVGIGAQVYKPFNPVMPTSVEECHLTNNTANWTMTTSMMTTDITNMTTEAPPSPSDQAGYLMFYELSYMWYSAFAVLVTNVVGLIVSAITGPTKAEDVDPRLLCPIFDLCCCCLPKSWRQKLRCNVDHTDKFKENEEDIAKPKNGEVSKITNGIYNPAMEDPKAYTSRTSIDSIQFETHL